MLTLRGPAAKGSPLRQRFLAPVLVGRLPPLPRFGDVILGPAPVPPLYAGPLTAGPPVTLALLPDAVIPGKLLPVAHALSMAIISRNKTACKGFGIMLK